MLELDDVYPLIENAEGSLLFETYGEDFEKVKATDYKKVWTIVDGDGDSDTLFAIPGFHSVNRFAYAISTIEWKDEKEEYTWGAE
jgi:hypothetical protein